MRIVLDRQRCVGSGNCVLSAPAMFDQSDADGQVVPRAPLPPSGVPDEARVAVELCPSGALSLADD
jgi:ferredoxin